MITQLTVWRLYTKYGALVWSLLQCGVAQIERYCVSDHRWHVTNPLPSYLNFFLMRRWIIPENCLKKEGNWSLGCNNSMLRISFPFLQENYLYRYISRCSIATLPSMATLPSFHIILFGSLTTMVSSITLKPITNCWFGHFLKKARNTG